MDAESILESVAEIAVSLAGFAGIIGAFAGERLRQSDPEIWLPFWAMISTSLTVLFGALLPFLPHYLGASDRVAWAASSAFLTIATACNIVFFIPRILRAQRDGILGRIPALEVPLRISTLLLLISQAVNTVGLGLDQSTGGFLIGLYLALLMAGLDFVFLLFVLGRAPGRPPTV